MYDTIEKFNQFLIKKQVKLDINEYFQTMNDTFYSNCIEQKYLNRFILNLSEPDNSYCITKNDLLRDNIIVTEKRMSKNIRKLISDCNLILDKDYVILTDHSTTDLKKEYLFNLSSFYKMSLYAHNCNNRYKSMYEKCNAILMYYKSYANLLI